MIHSKRVDTLRLLYQYIVNILTRAMPSSKQLMLLMKKRRSIMPYKFNKTIIETHKIKKLLESASYAPTHKLTYPWRFVVIDKKSHHKLHTVTYDVMKMHYAENSCLSQKLKGLEDDVTQRWNNVSHYIGVCVKKSNKVPEWEEIAAVSCAVQNMLLMAPCLGIACYWSSWHSETTNHPSFLDFLGMSHDNGDLCLGFLVLGYSDSVLLYDRKPTNHEGATRWL